MQYIFSHVVFSLSLSFFFLFIFQRIKKRNPTILSLALKDQIKYLYFNNNNNNNSNSSNDFEHNHFLLDFLMRQISQSIEYLQYIDKLISQKKHLHQCEKQYKCYQGNKLETKKMYHAESQEIKWEKEKKRKLRQSYFEYFFRNSNMIGLVILPILLVQSRKNFILIVNSILFLFFF